MRIRPVEKEQAPEIVRRIYESLEKAAGVTNLHRMLAHKPEALRAYTQLSGALWAPSALEERLKDLAFLRASIVNGCEF